VQITKLLITQFSPAPCDSSPLWLQPPVTPTPCHSNPLSLQPPVTPASYWPAPGIALSLCRKQTRVRSVDRTARQVHVRLGATTNLTNFTMTDRVSNLDPLDVSQHVLFVPIVSWRTTSGLHTDPCNFIQKLDMNRLSCPRPAYNCTVRLCALSVTFFSQLHTVNIGSQEIMFLKQNKTVYVMRIITQTHFISNCRSR
jgi:hypothetical protein